MRRTGQWIGRWKFFSAFMFIVICAICWQPRAAKTVALSIPGVQQSYIAASFDGEERQIAADIKRDLGELMGNVALAYLETLESVRDAGERERRIAANSTRLRVHGFEEAGVVDAMMAALVNDTLPFGCRAGMSEIVHRGSKARMAFATLMRGLFYGVFSPPGGYVPPFSRRIVFLPPHRPATIAMGKERRLASLLMHEVGHLCDWNSNTLMTRRERLRLLRIVLGRVLSASAYHTPSHKQLDASGAMQRYFKAIEYFADVNAQYLRCSDRLLPPLDVDLIQRLHAKISPGFLQAQACRTRLSIVVTAERRKWPAVARERLAGSNESAGRK